MKVRIKAPPPPAPDEGSGFSPLNYETTREALDGVWGHITKHGIKVMADGRQWVLHCLTGQPMLRESAKPFRDNQNNIFWIGKDEAISPVDRPTFHQWKNPDHSTV